METHQGTIHGDRQGTIHGDSPGDDLWRPPGTIHGDGQGTIHGDRQETIHGNRQEIIHGDPPGDNPWRPTRETFQGKTSGETVRKTHQEGNGKHPFLSLNQHFYNYSSYNSKGKLNIFSPITILFLFSPVTILSISLTNAPLSSLSLIFLLLLPKLVDHLLSCACL